MTKLYPAIKENYHFSLKVDDIHTLYVEESGNPDGIPIVFLHGGPGAGCEPWHRQFFDPESYRIILFDQRGCGKSIPHAELENNTTADLIADMENIREHLNIKKWVVFGGSWGSTLGLAYAETHPEKTLGLIVRGIFLCRPREIHWYYQEGASRIFPDYWQNFLEPIPENQHDNLLQAYYQQLTGNNELARMRAAKAWSTWEGQTANLQSKHSVVEHFSNPHTALSVARIEAHYFVNNGFLTDNQLLNDAERLKDIPGDIIHGRYDMICPVEQAFELAEQWPNADLQIIPATGHAASEDGIISALIQSTQKNVGKNKMIGLIQRVTHADVVVDEKTIGQISQGILLLLGVQKNDDEATADKLLKKVLNYRIFEDDAGKMNRSLLDIQGGLLVVPQFTLAADTQKGLRPSFSSAAPPQLGESLFNYFLEKASKNIQTIEKGQFGSDMKVSLCNDGPATFWLEIRLET